MHSGGGELLHEASASFGLFPDAHPARQPNPLRRQPGLDFALVRALASGRDLARGVSSAAPPTPLLLPLRAASGPLRPLLRGR
eukprot:12485836-Alexandrium_andersonii.AAC.1